MKIVLKASLTVKEKETIGLLWNNEYPLKLKFKNSKEFDFYLKSLSHTRHYLLLDENNKIKGWGLCFLRGGHDWFALIINDQEQGKGYGSLMLKKLKQGKDSLNGWVIDHQKDFKENGERYKSPLSFYIKNHFVICKEIRIENEKISAVKINWTSK